MRSQVPKRAPPPVSLFPNRKYYLARSVLWKKVQQNDQIWPPFAMCRHRLYNEWCRFPVSFLLMKVSKLHRGSWQQLGFKTQKSRMQGDKVCSTFCHSFPISDLPWKKITWEWNSYRRNHYKISLFSTKFSLFMVILHRCPSDTERDPLSAYRTYRLWQSRCRGEEL